MKNSISAARDIPLPRKAGEGQGGGMLRSACLAALLLLVPISLSLAAEARSKARTSTASPQAQPNDAASSATVPDSAKAEREVATHPHDRTARLDAARAQLAEGADNRSNVQAAQRHADAVLEDHPNDVEALLLGGQIRLLQNDPASAVRYYRAATQADATNATAYLGLGDALTRLGDEAGATAAFAQYRILMGLPALTTDGENP